MVGLIDAAGNLVNRYEYDVWGQPASTTEAVPQPLRYGARIYDAATGLQNHRARWYDPEMRRFVSQDPIGLAGASTRTRTRTTAR